MPTSTADPAIKFVISHLAGFKTPKILTQYVFFHPSHSTLLQLQTPKKPNLSTPKSCLSNGGIGHLTVLARAYHHHTQGTSLPLSTIIYDSAPTRGDFRSLFSALSQGFPRNPLLRFLPSVLLSLLITLFFILPRALGFTNTADRVCNDLLGKSTEGQRFIPDEATRTFVYSDTDRMTPMAEVLVEAKLAEGRGMKVRREMWVGSGHVGHMRADPERYWRVVGESWRWSASE